MDLVIVGRISGTHHLKGAVKVISDIGDLNSLIGHKVILELSTKNDKILTLKNVTHMNERKWILEFEEIISKSDADSIQSSIIKVRRDILGISEDEFMKNDVIGMKVFTIEGEPLGKITEIYETAAHDIYVIEDENYETMIPDVEVFVKEINFDENKMTVSIIDGMRERKKI